MQVRLHRSTVSGQPVRGRVQAEDVEAGWERKRQGEASSSVTACSGVSSRPERTGSQEAKLSWRQLVISVWILMVYIVLKPPC